MTPSFPGNLFTVSAPSGAGKTSLVKALLDRDRLLQVSVSHTTRPIRPGEINGLNYHFVTREAFLDLKDQNGFIECAEVFGNWYGTAKTWVERALQDGRDIVLEIDWQGAEQIKRIWPETCAIFILPPSHDTLRERLEGRGQDSAEVIAKRLAEAELEMTHYTISDFMVVNDDFATALGELQTIVQAHRLSTQNQAQKHSSLLCDLIPSHTLRNK